MRTAKSKRDKPISHLVDDKVDVNQQQVVGYEVAGQLRDLLKNEGLPASARVTAARTLAEIEGLIGRHQPAPERGATAALSSLSRDQLIDELGRLRTLVDLGLVR